MKRLLGSCLPAHLVCCPHPGPVLFILDWGQGGIQGSLLEKHWQHINNLVILENRGDRAVILLATVAAEKAQHV